MWSFRPKVDSPEVVASPGLVRDHSTDDKQHSTTQLIEDAFIWIILPQLLKQVKRSARY